MPKKKKKIAVDSRFGEIFDPKSDFLTISKVDKTGKAIQKKDKMMHKFYKLDDDEEKVAKAAAGSESEGSDEESSSGEVKGKKFYDENGNFTWNKESEESSSS